MTRTTRTRSIAIVALTLTLTGCATTVSMEPAAEANDPLCADAMVRLPDSVDGQDRKWTDAQATAAYGSTDETTVLFTCGLETPGPSVLPCQSVDGIDWLVDDSEAPYYRFTTYGRTPAVEVYLDYDVVSGFTVLDRLSASVHQLPSSARCTATDGSTSADDTL